MLLKYFVPVLLLAVCYAEPNIDLPYLNLPSAPIPSYLPSNVYYKYASRVYPEPVDDLVALNALKLGKKITYVVHKPVPLPAKKVIVNYEPPVYKPIPSPNRVFLNYEAPVVQAAKKVLINYEPPVVPAAKRLLYGTLPLDNVYIPKTPLRPIIEPRPLKLSSPVLHEETLDGYYKIKENLQPIQYETEEVY